MRLFFKVVADGIKKAYDRMRNGKEYRQYQVDTLHNLTKVRNNGGKRALVKLATGAGKTTIASMDIMIFSKQFEKEHGRKPRILWLAHREELLTQAEDDVVERIEADNSNQDEQRIESIVADIEKESVLMGDPLSVSREILEFKDGVLVTSVQKLSYGDNLDDMQGDFDYVVIDEAHHSYADSYMKIIEKYKDAFFVGLTATPQRFSDRRNVEEIFPEIVVDRNLVEMIHDDYLSTMYFHRVDTDVSLAANYSQYGEYSLFKLWKSFGDEGQRKRDQLVVDTYLNLHDQKGHYSRIGQGKIDFEHKCDAPAITFAMNIEHAKSLAKLYTDSGVRAVAIHGKMSKAQRRETLEQYRLGEFSMLVAVDILNEGVDIPEIEVALMARPTRSKMIYMQQIGRLARKSEESGKKSALIIDFVDNMGEYNRPIVHSDIFRQVTRNTSTDQKDSVKRQIVDIIEVVDIVDVDMEEIFGGVTIVKKDEACVSSSDSDLALINGVVAKVARELNKILGNPRDSHKEQIEYGGVTFCLRRSGIQKVWAFKKTELENVAKILGRRLSQPIKRVGLDEIRVAQLDKRFQLLKGSVRKNARLMNGILGDPYNCDVTEKISDGVAFYLRSSGARRVWVFHEKDLMAVGNLLNVLIDVLPVNGDESLNSTHDKVSVTQSDILFGRIEGFTSELARRLNEILGNPRESTEIEKNINGVRFFLGKKGTTPVWLFNKVDLKNVATIVGSFYRDFDIQEVGEDEVPVIGEGGEFAMISGKTGANAKELNGILGDPKTYQKEECEYKGIRFLLRRKGTNAVWALKINKLEDVAKALDRRLDRFPVYLLSEVGTSEFCVSQSDKVFQSIRSWSVAARQLNALLGNPIEAVQDEKKLDRISFYLRRNRNYPVWVTSKDNLVAVARILGRELRD